MAVENRPDTATLRRWYETDGRTLREMGALAGVSYQTIANWMDDAGIPRRDNPVPGPATRLPQRPDNTILRRLSVDDDLPAADIAVQLGLPREKDGTVRRWLREAGIPPRVTPSRRRPTPKPAATVCDGPGCDSADLVTPAEVAGRMRELGYQVEVGSVWVWAARTHQGRGITHAYPAPCQGPNDSSRRHWVDVLEWAIDSGRLKPAAREMSARRYGGPGR